MKYFKMLSVTIISMVFLQACNDDDDNSKIEILEPKITIVDVAVSNGNFTTLVAALQATGAWPSTCFLGRPPLRLPR